MPYRAGIVFEAWSQTMSAPAFAAPGTAAVARFLGYNLYQDGAGSWAVHPTEVTITSDGSGAPGRVLASGAVGDRSLVVVERDDGPRWEVRGPPTGPRPADGARVGLAWSRAVPVEETPGPGTGSRPGRNDKPASGLAPP